MNQKLIKNNYVRYVGDVKRSTFDLTHQRTLTAALNKLTPILNHHMLPGDYIEIKTDALFRSIPLFSPLMHEMNVKIFYTFTPYRLLWDGVQTFLKGGLQGDTSQTWPHAKLVTDIDNSVGSLADHLRVPSGTSVGTDVLVSLLDFRCYNTNFNEWFRNPNIVAPVTTLTSGGYDTTTNTDLLSPMWERDYFTSAYLSPQAGTGVELPIGTTAPIVASGDIDTVSNGTEFSYSDNGTGHNFADTRLQASSGNIVLNGGGGSSGNLIFGDATGSKVTQADLESTLSVDLTGASAVTITELRQASALQRWREKAMRAGLGAIGRYTSLISEFFGIVPADASLQRPELLGGFKSPLIFSEVLQTGETGTTPQGNMAGHGITGLNGGKITYACQEWGILMAFMYIQPKTQYQQSLPRDFTRSQAIDYAWPDFALVGEQELRNQEVFLQADGAGTPGVSTNVDVFGYQRRYAEYMEIVNTTHGQMRTTLDYWNMTRQFTTLPTLSTAFVTQDADQRPFSVTDPAVQDPFLIQMVHSITSMRCLPRFEENYRLM